MSGSSEKRFVFKLFTIAHRAYNSGAKSKGAERLQSCTRITLVYMFQSCISFEAFLSQRLDIYVVESRLCYGQEDHECKVSILIYTHQWNSTSASEACWDG